MESFIGKKLSLVTKAEIRYTGVVEAIDMTEHTITLGGGASLLGRARKGICGGHCANRDVFCSRVRLYVCAGRSAGGGRI